MKSDADIGRQMQPRTKSVSRDETRKEVPHRTLLHLKQGVIYNRLDGRAYNPLSMSAARLKLVFALARPAGRDVEKAELSVTSSTFSFCCFSNRVRKLWTANTHEVRFRRSEAA